MLPKVMIYAFDPAGNWDGREMERQGSGSLLEPFLVLSLCGGAVPYWWVEKPSLSSSKDR